MDAWTTRPDRDPRRTLVQILRCKPGKAISGIVTAADLVGAYTHYWKGRTRICTHPLCEACDAQRTARWYGYLAVTAPTTRTPAILEITPATLDAIDQYAATYATLRGALITVRRANPKPNSRLIAELKPALLDGQPLPDPPDVRHQLCTMWEITEPQQRDALFQRTAVCAPTNGTYHPPS